MVLARNPGFNVSLMNLSLLLRRATNHHQHRHHRRATAAAAASSTRRSGAPPPVRENPPLSRASSCLSLPNSDPRSFNRAPITSLKTTLAAPPKRAQFSARKGDEDRRPRNDSPLPPPVVKPVDTASYLEPRERQRESCVVGKLAFLRPTLRYCE